MMVNMGRGVFFFMGALTPRLPALCSASRELMLFELFFEDTNNLLVCFSGRRMNKKEREKTKKKERKKVLTNLFSIPVPFLRETTAIQAWTRAGFFPFSLMYFHGTVRLMSQSV